MSRMKQTWRAPVRDVYASLEELQAYDAIYGTARRCGYSSAEALWRENPTIGGSVYPEAFGRAVFIRRVVTLVSDSKERLRKVRWYQPQHAGGRPLAAPQPTVALAWVALER